MALYQLKSSFAGGELSPSMYGRTDIAKYDSGAATLRNFLVLRYGGAANRPGFKFIAQTYNNKKAVLIHLCIVQTKIILSKLQPADAGFIKMVILLEMIMDHHTV